MNEALYDIVLEKILADDAVGAAGDVVLAACSGAASLQALLQGSEEPVRVRLQPNELGDEPGVGLASISVEGFRGIGKRVKLPLEPGPGLTLVVGRNGSGKSSFAEALELLLTGRNLRWEERSSVWKDGWRNLHANNRCSVHAEFVVEGRDGLTTISRKWDPEHQLGDAPALVQPHGQPQITLSDRNLGPMFLSCASVDGKPF